MTQYPKATPITPSNTDNIPLTDAIYIGGAGNMRVTMHQGNVVTFNGLLAGTIYLFRVTRIHESGTTATNIISLGEK